MQCQYGAPLLSRECDRQYMHCMIKYMRGCWDGDGALLSQLHCISMTSNIKPSFRGRLLHSMGNFLDIMYLIVYDDKRQAKLIG